MPNSKTKKTQKTTAKPVAPAVATTKLTTERSTIQVTTNTPDKKRRHRPNVTVLLDTDDFAREQVGGFINFLREHAIVGLAVGFIIGQQAQGVVKQLVASFIDPFIQLLIGGARLSDRKIPVHLFHNSADFAWGAMLYVVINLLCVLATIYVLIKLLKLDKLDKPAAIVPVAAPVQTATKLDKPKP